MYEIPLLVIILKLIMVGVMLVGGLAVFRELIPMARGRQRSSPPAPAAAPEDA